MFPGVCHAHPLLRKNLRNFLKTHQTKSNEPTKNTMKTQTNTNDAPGTFSADDILNPRAVAV
jgi:hypothetical protein